MPLGAMRRKKAEEGEAAGAALAAPHPLDRPAKRTRAAVAAAAAAAAEAAVDAAVQQQQQQQQQQEKGKTDSGVGSTQQVDRCASSNPAGDVNSAQPTDKKQQEQQPAAAAPQAEGRRTVTGLRAPPSQPRQAKKRKLVRVGVPAPLPRSQLRVPDRPSPPVRADDADGHYVFEIGENLAPRCESKGGGMTCTALRGGPPGAAVDARSAGRLHVQGMPGTPAPPPPPRARPCIPPRAPHPPGAVKIMRKFGEGTFGQARPGRRAAGAPACPALVLTWPAWSTPLPPLGPLPQVLECWDRYRRDYVAVKVIRNIQARGNGGRGVGVATS